LEKTGGYIVNDQILVRIGDGERVSMSASEVKEDILAGTRDAADRGQIPELTQDELDTLFETFADPNRTVSVRPGNEVITTDDGAPGMMVADRPDGGIGLPMGYFNAVMAYERVVCADTAGIGHYDYSCKPVKSIINYEKQRYYNYAQSATIPLIYGCQPNLGLYYQPDGPFPNAAELIPQGKIDEAREAQEKAAEALTEDLIFIARELNEVGCDGFNFDTAGSAGDADLYATLKAMEQIKKIAPDMALELGMASEFVLGMHGEIEYNGKRLAGMYPHEQVKVAEEAGADIFGCAINVNASESAPWNLARAVTFVKATTAVAKIPVHPNVGMGVCGIPMVEIPTIDAVSQAAKSLVEIGKADGL
jgi:dimethylamine--corrinoid protein Co-methyltransferase